MADSITTVHDVAAAVIERHHPIDPVTLHTIVFHAAGEFAALTGKQMFPEPIEAWDHGPVIYDMWQTYRKYEGEVAIVDPEQGDATKLNALENGCVEAALEKCGERSGTDLTEGTRREPAWKETYMPGQTHTEIPAALIVSTFRAKYANVDIPQDVLGQLFAR